MISVNKEQFIKTIHELAAEDGTDFILMLPGVWDSVREYYNNEAIRRIEYENE